MLVLTEPLGGSQGQTLKPYFIFFFGAFCPLPGHSTGPRSLENPKPLIRVRTARRKRSKASLFFPKHIAHTQHSDDTPPRLWGCFWVARHSWLGSTAAEVVVKNSLCVFENLCQKEKKDGETRLLRVLLRIACSSHKALESRDFHWGLPRGCSELKSGALQTSCFRDVVSCPSG